MANENLQNSALSESMNALEKCLDSMLAEQRKSAHTAIDMDDWSKAEEILARTKNNIARIESLKGKFVEFKGEAAKLGFVPADGSKPEQDKPAEAAKAAPASEPAEKAKPDAEAQPAPSKPAEAPKPAEPAKPAELPKPAPAPAQPKPAPAPVQPKPAPAPAQPKPAPAPVQPKPAPAPVQPKPAPAPAQPKPAPAPAQPKPAPAVQAVRPAENTTRLDFEMDDIDETPKPDPNNPIILACEELITRFPFSMKLISKHDKIGKFFRDDETAAKRDLSKPAQLSSGIWVETNVPEERVQVFIKSIKRYCDESVNA